MNRTQVVQQIEENAAIAVLRLPSPEDALPVTESLLEGGVKSIEITLSTPNTFEVIETISTHFKDDALVGIGSVTQPEQARQAIEAGALYIVSPVFKPEIIAKAHQLGVAAIPGGFTPTEIQLAYEAGADIVKVFPADIVGIPFFKGIKAPLPHLKLIPTGGVSLTNAGEWLNAGACAVGLGSALIDKKAIAEKNYSKLTQNAKLLMDTIHQSKTS